MKKKIIAALLALTFAAATLAGCSGVQEAAAPVSEAPAESTEEAPAEEAEDEATSENARTAQSLRLTAACSISTRHMAISEH